MKFAHNEYYKGSIPLGLKFIILRKIIYFLIIILLINLCNKIKLLIEIIYSILLVLL
jgi:hypothetical protein